MNTQTVDIEQVVDLVSLVESDLGPGRRYGRWVVFRCPFHDDKHPSLAVTNGDGRGPYWRCFSAACGKQGGPVKWRMEYDQMSYREAIRDLTKNTYQSSNGGGAVCGNYEFDYPPGEAWQRRAGDLIKWAEGNLWGDLGSNYLIDWPEVDPETGEVITRRLSALDWLLARGLSAETLKFWKVGYIPPDLNRPFWTDTAERWGLTGKRVFIPQGILIPCIIGGQVWYLKIRRPEPKGQKYIHIREGQQALYLAQTLEWQEAVFFCEGELDALLLWQEIGDQAGVVTLGSAENPLNIMSWGLCLIKTKKRFIVYDSDAAGDKGAENLTWMGKSRRVNIPRLRANDKDITDYWRSGGDVREWASSVLDGLNNAPESPREGLREII